MATSNDITIERLVIDGRECARIEGMGRSLLVDLSDRCEWNPQLDTAAEASAGCPQRAAVIVGANGQWRLCKACSALPRFRRFKKRDIPSCYVTKTSLGEVYADATPQLAESSQRATDATIKNPQDIPRSAST